MKLLRAIAIAAIAVPFVQTSAAQAQNISNVQAPAEFPPSSFTGRQYVDSNGCVFVRAGIDGNVSWVPRVSRDRKVICGFQPSLPGAGSTVQLQPKPASEPVQITVTEPAPSQPAPAPAKPAPEPKPVAVVQAKPAPAPKPVAQPKPVQQPIIIAQPKPVTAPAAQPTIVRSTQATSPTRVITVRPAQTNNATRVITVRPLQTATAQPATRVITVKPVAQPSPKTVTIATAKPAPAPKTMAPRQSACRGASAISSQYLTVKEGLPVRCGPQEGWNVSVIRGGSAQTGTNTAMAVTAPAPSYQSASTTSYSYQKPAPLKRAETKVVRVTPNTRIVPKHVYQQQVAATNGVYIPKGYKPVWEDDRLNPKRAHQTMAGKQQMELRWTNTVPRRLINAATGQDVHYLYPGLQYPNTSYDQQIIAGVSASAPGAGKTQPVRAPSALQTRESMEAKPARTTRQSASRVTVSTRSTPVKTKTAQRSTSAKPSHKYVQAGLFPDMATAKRHAQRLANAGLPAKMAKRTRNGQVQGVVVTGPFATQAQLNAALSKVRSMGFGGAFLRN